MRRLAVPAGLFVLLLIVAASSGANAQDDSLPALQTRVAELEATVSAQSTQIAILQDEADLDPRCVAVQQTAIDSFLIGIESPEGMSLVAVRAVKSTDFSNLYFVAGTLLGPGMGDGEIVVLVTNDIVTPTFVASVNNMAQEFFVYPDADSSDAPITMDDDGAETAKGCAEKLIDR